MMSSFSLQTSTRSLIRTQMRASISRMLRRFRSPRRIVLTMIGLVLALVWIGQAIAGIMFRESADLEKLKLWIPLSLTAYALWNVIKVTCRKRIEPFEWTPTEKELLIAAPIERGELIRYRMSSIFRAAVFKSVIFSLVMIPDLHIVPLGFIGMLAGLLTIDLIRMLSEVVVWGLRKNELLFLRAVVISLTAGAAIYAIQWAFQNSDVSADLATVASLGFLLKIVSGFVALGATSIGIFVVGPFRLVAEVILAESLSLELLWRSLTCLGAVWALFKLLICVDRVIEKRAAVIQRENLAVLKQQTTKQPRLNTKIRSRQKPAWLGGVGPLGWRQLLGARKYRGQLLFAMAVPLALSCLPAIGGKLSGLMMVMNVVGGLAFYSFLLLPTTLPFDMRKDFDRITVLKSLPISPYRVVLGQLMAPVILTTAFQFVTLLAAMAISPYHPGLFLIAMLILTPFNLFVFGLENLLALWYPYRMNKEGVQVFLRSVLSFTAKGILFSLAVGLILLWVFISKWISGYAGGSQVAMSIVFATGCFVGLSIVATGLVALLARSFERFDPSCDLAGLD